MDSSDRLFRMTVRWEARLLAIYIYPLNSFYETRNGKFLGAVFSYYDNFLIIS